MASCTRTRFPILPGVVGNVVRTAADPEFQVAELARVLETDAVLSAQVLKAVNSATFGLRHKVSGVDHAVTVMGVRAVRNLVLSLCVRNLVPAREVSGFPLEVYWEGSLRRAAAARSIAEHLGLPNVEEFFTIGLCQDIGLLVLLGKEPELAERLKAAVRESSDRRLQIEQDRGSGHDRISAEMFAEWKFPEELVQPVRYHHRPQEAPQAYRMGARVAHAAEAMADLSLAGDRNAAIQTVTERLEVLGLKPDDLEEIVTKVNGVVNEFAELLGLEVGDQPTYEEIIATASTCLADLNSSYEEQNRTLESALAEEERRSAQLKKLNLDLDRQARSDKLTGLANRRALGEVLARELAIAQRRGTPVSLVMFDLDRFKRINDSHGHPAGDRVLEEIGRILKREIRTSDFVARYGGEEFAIVLPFTDESGARIVTERVREAIASTPIRHLDLELRVTASFGGTTERIEDLQEDTASRLVKCADEGVYRSKAAGGNCVDWNRSTPQAVP